MVKFICEGVIYITLTVLNVVMCSFSEHSHGSNGTIKVNTIGEITDGGKYEWIADVVMYGFGGIVCLVIVFHCYLKRQRKKQLKKSEGGDRYQFDWERTGEDE